MKSILIDCYRHFITPLFLVLVTISTTATAGDLGLTGPASNTTGSYALSWNNSINSCGFDYYVLRENGITIYQGCNDAFTATNKPKGTYNYALTACVYEAEIATLACDSDSGHTVTVLGQAVITSFTLSPPGPNLLTTDSITVNWAATNADYCTISGDPTQYPTSNSITFPGGTFQPGVYQNTFYCTGPGGTSTAITVNLNISDGNQAAQLLSFEIDNPDDTLFENEVLRVNWSSSGATGCFLTGDSFNWGTNGAETFPPNSFDPGVYDFEFYCSGPGGNSAPIQRTLTVKASRIELIGFDPNYQIFGAHGRDDLLIVRNGSDGNSAGVKAFVLEPDAVPEAGDFYRIRTNPTPSDFAALSIPAPQLPGNVNYEVADIDANGAFDMVIKGLAGTSATPGRLNTIVYAGGYSNSDPVEIKEIDQDFRDFFTQLNSFVDNPNYFEDNAPLIQTNKNVFTDILYAGYASFANSGLINYWILSCSLVRDVATFVEGRSTDVEFPQYDANGYTIFHNGPGEATGLHIFCANVEKEKIHDYTVFHQGALAVSEPVNDYMSRGVYQEILVDVLQIIGERLGVYRAADDVPGIINKIKVVSQVIFGAGVKQTALIAPVGFHRLELLYTDVGLTGLPPSARHAYVQVTSSSGERFVTRGGPEELPSYPVFGEIEARSAANPTSSAIFPDYGKPILFRQEVGLIPVPSFLYSTLFTTFAISTNTANIDYKLLTQNSNSYAFQVVERITGLRPRAIPYAPGWSKQLSAP